jgi:hypothetical protein
MGADLADVARETTVLWALAATHFPAACLAEAFPAWRARRR